MDDFVSFEMLTTWVSFLTLVLATTQFIKNIWLLKKINTKYISFFVALVLLVVTNLALGTFSVNNIILYILSSVIAGMNANGIYDFSTNIKKDS